MAAPVLAPVDFSDPSLFAVEQAATLARSSGGVLILLNVVDHVQLPQGSAALYDAAAHPKKLLESAVAAAVAKLEKIAAPLRRGRLKVDVCAAPGSPAREIVKMAKKKKAGLVVMGTHGRTGLKHLLMGSVAEAVVQSSASPVMTIRLPKGRSRR